jgi:hypothetical protein
MPDSVDSLLMRVFATVCDVGTTRTCSFLELRSGFGRPVPISSNLELEQTGKNTVFQSNWSYRCLRHSWALIKGLLLPGDFVGSLLGFAKCLNMCRKVHDLFCLLGVVDSPFTLFDHRLVLFEC